MRTLIWGFEGSEGKRVVEALSRQPQIELVHWVNDNYEADDIFKYFNLKFNPYPKAVESCDRIYSEVYKELNIFINMFSRHYQDYSYTYHDFVDAFNILFNSLLQTIKEKNVERIIFASLPHEGADFIAYQIGKALKLEIIMLYQSLFPNKFFYCSLLEDFGSFSGISGAFKNPNIQVENKHLTDLFYMKDIPKKPSSSRVTTKERLSGFWSLLKSNYNYRHIFDFLRNTYEYRYQANTSVLTRPLNQKADYVYFPLALQPELTTSAIGGVFNDQILAIERLRSILPADWVIAVKENPKQTSFQRGDLFFKRLSAVENVVLVPFDANTFELIARSRFVSVVTGSAGWESIKGGKNVLVFGSPWFLTLPGVFYYEEMKSIDEILDYKIDHEALTSAFNTLLTKAADGVIDFAYRTLVPDFNPEHNAEITARSIIRAINNRV